MEVKECYYEGCNEIAVVKDLCLKHYNLWLGNIDDKLKRNRSLEERFWFSVWKPTKDGCWIWKGGLSIKGYGELFLDRHKRFPAHRLSWEIHYGAIPETLMVLHNCDTPSCVNPKHLFLGTHADNAKDMVEKGRSLYGERNSHAKLTEDEVLKIRFLRRVSFFSYDFLAKMFNVHCSTIGRIICYEKWNYPEILRREAERVGV